MPRTQKSIALLFIKINQEDSNPQINSTPSRRIGLGTDSRAHLLMSTYSVVRIFHASKAVCLLPQQNKNHRKDDILFCGVYWTKFEIISSKIQMIKTTNADSAGRNNLSGGKDSPCLGCFPARRRGLGRNAGGISAGFFFLFANA